MWAMVIRDVLLLLPSMAPYEEGIRLKFSLHLEAFAQSLNIGQGPLGANQGEEWKGQEAGGQN